MPSTALENVRHAPEGWTPGQIESRYVAAQSLTPRSYNEKDRTIEAVFATGYRVRRWFGWEELAIRDDAINLQRVGLGKVRLLDHHNQFERNAVLGVVTDARIANGALVGTIRFSDSDAGLAAERQVSSGELTGISVGYRINKLILSETGEDDDVYRADAWELLEVSLVSVPADPHAGVRSADTLPRKSQMLETETTTAAERQRTADITFIGRKAGLDDEVIQSAIRNNTSLSDFRQLAFDKLAADADKIRISAVHTSVEFGRQDSDETLQTAITGALVSRMSGAAPEGPAREYAGRSLLELGSALLQARGERVSWLGRDQLAERIMARGMHSTSDFPALLNTAGNRVLADSYKVAQSPLKALARRRTRVDFRDVTGINLSEPPRLLKVNESGEIRHGSRVEESRPRYKIDDYGRIFALTRRALVNDDLSAFGDALSAFGRGAAATEADLLADLFLTNGGNGTTLWDNKPLFHADHRNRAPSGAPLSIDSLGQARQAMREQTDIDGKSLINVSPRHLVVGPALETAAEQILATIAATQSDHVNPFAGRLTLHVEPRFTGNAWRLFADPAELPCIEVAYLEGNEGPQLSMKEGWTTLGQEFRALLTFGCGVVEFRSAYLNPGA
ncbi:prohead protease/major capsid protein fusion protein [Microvirga antarctica]|uniref:prohead protease/major capsid protein fusion protein n=1 Tax=Microvirga antarctica TaxID=2819233 RepID=UPI001B3116B3|nr:prohead protease/major capsid protein fusion protein [Microvirga antarctica]